MRESVESLRRQAHEALINAALRRTAGALLSWQRAP